MLTFFWPYSHSYHTQALIEEASFSIQQSEISVLF